MTHTRHDMLAMPQEINDDISRHASGQSRAAGFTWVECADAEDEAPSIGFVCKQPSTTARCV